MFCYTSRYTHKTFPMFKTWKAVFVYINIYFSRSHPLIKTPCLLMLDTFVFSQATIQTHPTPCDLFCTVKSIFFKIEVFLVITGCRKKKQNVRFSVWCAGVVICGCLLVVTIRLLVVCSRLWLFAGSYYSFVGSL